MATTYKKGDSMIKKSSKTGKVLISTLKEIVPELYRDLKELFDLGQIKEAMRLTSEYSKTLSKPFYFAHHKIPHYPVRNFDCPTVFVNLNPGTGLGDTSSMDCFFKQKWNGCFNGNDILQKSKNIDELLRNYIEEWESYAHKRFDEKGEKDNFDYKTACFLLYWPDNGIDLKRGDLKDNEVQRYNTINVIDQKLQLELFPYGSNTISTNLLDNIFENNPKLLIPYIEKLFDIITLYPHKYVLFGSRVYDTLFKLYNSKVKKIIEYKSDEQRFDGITKNSLNFTFVRLKWNDKIFDAGIAHSFPRRDLSNAFVKMAAYGKACAEYYIKIQNEINNI